MTLGRAERSGAIAILLACAAASAVWSQTASFQDQFNAAYKGKILLLRNFYSGKDLRFDENGVLLGTAGHMPWSLAGVEVLSIAPSVDEIEIAANRVGFWYRGGKREAVRGGKLKVHIATGPSAVKSEAAVDAVLSKVFMQPEEDLRPVVPDYWKYYLSGDDSKTKQAGWGSALLGDKPTKIDEAQHSPAGAVTPPRPIRTPDPKYTKEAAAHRIEGTSRLGIVVDSTGTVGNLLILEPLGMGLDEQAVLAVKQWKFRPAVRDGRPIEVQTIVNVVFKCYSQGCS